MKFNTKVIHAGLENTDPAYGAVMTPIYQTTTFRQQIDGKHPDFVYARTSNPTRSGLETALAQLENGSFGLAFSSGMAAIDAVMRLLKPGDEVIATEDLYGGTFRLFTKVIQNMGVKFHFINFNDLDELNDAINEHTRLIWIETPTNPMMRILNIKDIAAVASSHKILFAVDNTFATPFLQKPLELGADIVMHSATKYLGGHSDVLAGALVVKDVQLAEKLYFIQNACGAVCAPQDSFLVLRGLKTLHVRMHRHCENARVIAEFLNEHPKVHKVYWPGLKNHSNHQIAQEQMEDFGGMVSFSLKDYNLEKTKNVLNNFRLFTLAESLGGVESLVGHPATMTHASIHKSARVKLGIVDSLIRLSVGIEDADDLIEDLSQALATN